MGELHVTGAQSWDRELALAVCDGEPMFLVKVEKRWAVSRQKMRYERKWNSHVFSFFSEQEEKDPAWVETQSWALVEHPAGELAVSWNRSVDNRLSPADDPERVFTQVGTGKLRKTDADCEMFRKRPQG